MIGYILLVAAAIAMSAIVYVWLKSYVPKDVASCPDGVSVYVKELGCDNGVLNFTLKNNGRFSIDGYNIYATESAVQEVAVLDLIQYQQNSISGEDLTIFSSREGGTLNVGEESYYQVFDIPPSTKIFLIEITPTRTEKYNNKDIKVFCSNAKIREVIECQG